MYKGLCLLLSLALLLGCSRSDKPSRVEQNLLLTSADFTRYGIEGDGRFSRLITYWNRTTELTYEHNPGHGFFLHSSLKLFPEAGAALVNSMAESTGAGIGLDNGDVLQQELPLAGQYGSHSELKLLIKHGKPIGNLFSVSIGGKSFLALFTGLYFESAPAFEAFIAPKMAALRAYDPPDPIADWARQQVADDSESAAR
ncbi:hypothetical protein [Aquipseudomonas ullengensis]|uniref:Lipoprotein n=1 Tax=Aquipseudomonas ullengensis TaxID=2759166 RepID=A0A7W4QDB7_9GAMM|nr:hypothetical protein [Pseudomonas ullengensis]MBB2494388.1 hypothetical protein [Pseudomonas ullengensis]